MNARAVTLFCSLLALTFVACDKEGDTKTKDAASEPTDAEKASAKKEALLRASGIDPSTVKGLDAPASPTPEKGEPTETAPAATAQATPAPTAQEPVTPASGQPEGAAVAPGAPPLAQVEIVQGGTGPKTKLAYAFSPGQKLKFTVDMSITQNKSVNGQPLPSMPGGTITASGTSETLSFNSGIAERVNTFNVFSPGIEGLPPAAVEQMKAQLATLSGTQITEVVNDGGQLREVRVPPQLANNPQFIAVFQQLQDGMTKAYTMLPPEPVGVGAVWKATEEAEGPGVMIRQVSEITLKSIQGSKVVLETKMTHSAKPGPAVPGSPLQVTGMTGSGEGTATIDLKSLATDNKVVMNITVDTKITEPGQPQAAMVSSDTKMNVHFKTTK